MASSSPVEDTDENAPFSATLVRRKVIPLVRVKSREWLEHEFRHREPNEHFEVHVDPELLWPLQIHESFYPSSARLEDLVPISMLDLQLEKHHNGRVLIARTMGHPYRCIGIQNAIEQNDSAFGSLMVCNVDFSVKPNDILARGKLIAVKEPYYTPSFNGSADILVVHPCDLIELPPHHPMVPARWQRPALSAIEYKDRGNAAVKNKDYFPACQLYTYGLQMCTETGKTLEKDLLRNRALANLRIGKSEQALDDAQRALISEREETDVRIKACNMKALWRAGISAYHLGRFNDALAFFGRSLDLQPDDHDSMIYLSHSALRTFEQDECKYNFEEIHEQQYSMQSRVDCGSFLSLTEVRDSPLHRKGLFARHPIAAGDIVLCEKGHKVWFEGEGLADIPSGSDETEKTLHSLKQGMHGPLVASLVQQLSSNPRAAFKFWSLYDGGYGKSTECSIVDGQAVVDAFRVRKIVEYNAFGFTNSKALDDLLAATSTGVWIRASYMNHACSGNVVRAILGDLMIVRATCDIAKDEEILQSYVSPQLAQTETQAELKRKYGFTCACKLCVAEASYSPETHATRKRLLDKYIANGIGPSTERLYAQLGATYGHASHGLPRMPMITVAHGLLMLHLRMAWTTKILKSAKTVLAEMGIVVKQRDSEYYVERKGNFVASLAVDAATQAARACYHLKKAGEGACFEKLAKGLFTEAAGSSYGFDTKFGYLFHEKYEQE